MEPTEKVSVKEVIGAFEELNRKLPEPDPFYREKTLEDIYTIIEVQTNAHRVYNERLLEALKTNTESNIALGHTINNSILVATIFICVVMFFLA